jgi:hypothetical protein
MFREPISQLARVRCQIHVDLFHLFDHLLSGSVIGTELPCSHIAPLVITANNGPQDQVRHIVSNRAGEGGKDVGLVSNFGCVAANIER